MAKLGSDLLGLNFARVVFVDVTDDVRLGQDPMPVDCYPVLGVLSLPWFTVESLVPSGLVDLGYYYQWHLEPANYGEEWYVGMVKIDALNLDLPMPALGVASRPAAFAIPTLYPS